MRLSDFDYNLPKNLIAQNPVSPRDHSRLLIFDKEKKHIEQKHFYDITDYLKSGDVLVLNNSKVFPARLMGKKKDTGGKIEIFMHHVVKGSVWQCLVGGRGAREGLEIIFEKELACQILKNNQDGTWNIRFNKSGEELLDVVYRVGKTPLPPYIKRKGDKKTKDSEYYQTVYADNKKVGSVAAPTAGLHFTPRLIKKLEKKGVKFLYITLHVGLGTFAPVKKEDIKKHKIHTEWVEIKKDILKDILRAKSENKRIISVGTTSARALESCFSQSQFKDYSEIHKLKIENYSSWVDIFIYPGYKFRVVDCLITNFHLPKSTLLMLVSAFAGKKNIDKLYALAVKNKYRFFSYGDAMFIH